jgi:NhaA family Na+:H+ antiporter
MSVLAVVLSNSSMGPAFAAWWHTPFGLRLGGDAFTLPLIEWVNDGLLTVFFLVVGLEIKRELTVGRLATRRAAAFPVAAAFGGMVVPALIYSVVAPERFAHGWGIPIATDTAFAVALMVLLGARVPVDLRVFLTAAVIVDDLVAIIVVALFYSGAISLEYLAASAVVVVLLVALNRWNIYRVLPYAVLGVALWAFLHEAGLHATLAGVILAIVTPTRPPANLHALMAQAQTVLESEAVSAGDGVLRSGPSEPAMRALDAIHDRIESPASKLLRSIEPWSSYLVLPVFALANAGVVWSAEVVGGHGRLMLAITLGLVIGKPVGILAAAMLAARLGLAEKPGAYSWSQLTGAGALAGIGARLHYGVGMVGSKLVEKTVRNSVFGTQQALKDLKPAIKATRGGNGMRAKSYAAKVVALDSMALVELESGRPIKAIQATMQATSILGAVRGQIKTGI